MSISIETYRTLEQLDEKTRHAILMAVTDVEKGLENSVRREDFTELKAVVADISESVKELAEAQKRTEARVEELAEAQKRTEARVEELAQAQKRTEARVEELAQAQKETQKEVSRLDRALQELAEAQKRTEARVEELAQAQKETQKEVSRLDRALQELAEAQKRTEARVEELAEALKETRKEVGRLDRALQELTQVVKTLVGEVSDIKKQLGGLAMVVGYGLEDKLYPHIKRFVRARFGIEAREVARKNVVYPSGEYDEVNIYVAGIKDGKEVLAVGECKAQPGKKDIQRFDAMIKRLRDEFSCEVFPFVVGYTFSPDVEKFIREQYPSISFYKTYEVEYGE